jgi:hypothetical protein
MWRRIVAVLLALALPAGASAGPIRDSLEKAGRETTVVTPQETRSRGRFWTGIALIAGGGVLATLGAVELGDDEIGPDDGEDVGESDDGEDADGWGNKGLIGAGAAAATVGAVLLLTGGRKSGPVVTVRHTGIVVRHTVRF